MIVSVKGLMSLYEEATTKVRVDSVVSDKFSVKGKGKDSVLSPLLFAIVVGVVTEDARNGVLHEILYADDLILMSESMEGLQRKFVFLKATQESKGMKININKTKLTVNEIERKASRSKIDPCGMCGNSVMGNSTACSKSISRVYLRYCT